MSRPAGDVMVVDDQSGVRKLLSEVLGKEGYQVELAESGCEAIQKLTTYTPLLILLDMRMPYLSGLETLQEIRQICGAVPVVIMTAFDELDIITEAKELGVRHWIQKPFNLNDVCFLIKALLAEKPVKKQDEGLR
ncbi:chemotaxis protein CheY [Peptococcaceae bacterium SCADC1_2_3]|jgi:two-component system response regulator (stage 0 sporulation protein F)|nr:chemotaxis protein CheY [Peptococcaceae bacterium SCADC1_2_3]HBQ29325.1 response regulator [Desulfotomaculum sp.]HCJ78733.1 response regulator [Desulfotomaculum sp.]